MAKKIRRSIGDGLDRFEMIISERAYTRKVFSAQRFPRNESFRYHVNQCDPVTHPREPVEKGPAPDD